MNTRCARNLNGKLGGSEQAGLGCEQAGLSAGEKSVAGQGEQAVNQEDVKSIDLDLLGIHDHSYMPRKAQAFIEENFSQIIPGLSPAASRHSLVRFYGDSSVHQVSLSGFNLPFPFLLGGLKV